MEPRGSEISLEDKPQPRSSVSSNLGLQYGSFVNSLSSLTPQAVEKPALSPKRAYLVVTVLCYVNLINYMERFTIAGVLPAVQEFFGINDSSAALLQTVFICSFLLLAPLFGYLGDRYNRKYVMMGGLVVWIVTSACSSFVSKSQFWLLLLLRALVGIGEASYSTIAPTIIGDLFTGSQRSAMICVFYIFIPVGSGLGYITGAGITTLTKDWRWALRITPGMAVIGLFLVLFFCPNPPRGAAETDGKGVSRESSYLDDIKYLLKNKTFVWSTWGVTATTFLVGALAFWTPTFLSRARIIQQLQQPCTKEPWNSTDSYIFGAVTVVTGIMGGALGTFFSRRYRKKTPNVDPIICAVGLLIAAPGLLITVFIAELNIPATYVLIFICEVLISLNWAVMADILLYVVIPNRRSTAEAIQISLSHLLGDAGSPYLVGVVSDAIQRLNRFDAGGFHSLKFSFLMCVFVGFLGGLFFLMAARYIIEDSKAVRKYVEEEPEQNQSPAPQPPLELSNQEK